MQWLCNHEDQNMQRMAVAIISILAAKVSQQREPVYFISACDDQVAALGLVIRVHSLPLTSLVFLFRFFRQLSTEQTAQLGAELYIVKVNTKLHSPLLVSQPVSRVPSVM